VVEVVDKTANFLIGCVHRREYADRITRYSSSKISDHNM